MNCCWSRCWVASRMVWWGQRGRKKYRAGASTLTCTKDIGRSQDSIMCSYAAMLVISGAVRGKTQTTSICTIFGLLHLIDRAWIVQRKVLIQIESKLQLLQCWCTILAISQSTVSPRISFIPANVTAVIDGGQSSVRSVLIGHLRIDLTSEPHYWVQSIDPADLSRYSMSPRIRAVSHIVTFRNYQWHMVKDYGRWSYNDTRWITNLFCHDLSILRRWVTWAKRFAMSPLLEQ